MRAYYLSILISSLLLGFLTTGCQKKGADNSEFTGVKVHELKFYENLPENKDLFLGMLAGLKYDDETQHLFIQDLARSAIIEIDESSNVVNVFGSKGRGPGEVLHIENFFLSKEHLFIVDGEQFLINKYSRLDGQHISSLDYGELLNQIISPLLPNTDMNNRPFVTLNETILLPSQVDGKFLYQAINWNGDEIANIGELPTDCTATEDNDIIRSALESRNVPRRDLCLAFPVNDHSEPDELYIVYSAIPKIAKYSLSGRKIWEQTIARTPEIDSLMIDLSNIVDNRPDYLEPVRKYITGRNSPNGDLYLFTFMNQNALNFQRPMWIHQFDSEGGLINRYKIASNGELFTNFAGIDFKRSRILTATINDAEIRSYHF
ncbi:hypothetical protein DYD21_08400 [Rhodohalobacter sp. SW132]|uniref:BF3164 family lipoprotein n=1 Tax=Rhodohalobacter sp. SW132 TaxID=2293433 RepID=UPI000E3B4ECD|nr:hypothetical protein [Rhodohalobacter sp. SW132]REL37791.1 hypothetical protein DYD21_08400 [Rhodohalobacter sp. SW132]